MTNDRDDLSTVRPGGNRRVVDDVVTRRRGHELADLRGNRLVDSGVSGDAAGADRVRRERPRVGTARSVRRRSVLVPDLRTDVRPVVARLVELRPATGLRRGDVRPTDPRHMSDQKVAELHAGWNREGDARGRGRRPDRPGA